MKLKTERTKLTAKQEAFCINYFTMRNGTKAAIEAGYSPKTADVIAVENLRKPSIAARIEALREGVVNNAYANYEERLKILTKIARHDAETPVSPGHITQAVSELNKMEHIYETGATRDVNVVFVIGKGYQRDSPQIEPAGNQNPTLGYPDVQNNAKPPGNFTNNVQIEAKKESITNIVRTKKEEDDRRGRLSF